MKYIFLLLLLLPLFSCISFKKLFSEGEVAPHPDFLAEIPFEAPLQLIIIPVEIRGKTFRFLFDTGAPNVLSEELFRELALPVVRKGRVKDSNRQAQKLIFTRLDEITIAGVKFRNTGALVANLNAALEISCLEIDGIIGANLMKEAAWQIDYAAQTLRLADSLPDLLANRDSAWVLPFNTSSQFTPKITLQIGGQTVEDITFDSGSGGHLVAKLDTWEKLSEKPPHYKMVGLGAAGLYGRVIDSVYIALTPDIRAGEQALGSAIVNFGQKSSKKIGNQFLGDFIVTIDWAENRIYLQPRGNERQSLQGPGFSPHFEAGKLMVSSVLEGGPAAEAGLQRGDRLLFVNGIDCINLTESGYCKLLLEKPWNKAPTLDMVVERKGASVKVVIEKRSLFGE